METSNNPLEQDNNVDITSINVETPSSTQHLRIVDEIRIAIEEIGADLLYCFLHPVKTARYIFKE